MHNRDNQVDPQRDAEALRVLALLPPAPEWVPARDGITHDVAIIGGGQNGVALAFALRRLGVARVTVIDAAPAGAPGIWREPARMNVLRTPKHLNGPELDLAELSFRHWFEARHGVAAYDEIQFIKRLDWADYLDWFRAITKTPVRHDTTLQALTPHPDGVELQLSHGGKTLRETARKVVLTSGVAGFGGPSLPAFTTNLPAGSYAHTADRIDFSALQGRDVAVLGAAASAFDAAATALEQGARSVHLYARRQRLTNRAPLRLRGHAGAAPHFHLLPDETRWLLNVTARQHGATPPREALRRIAEHENFFIHAGADWQNVRADGERIRFDSGGQTHQADFLILGTGYHADVAKTPILAPLERDIATWADRYVAPADLADPTLSLSPYLGPDFELTEKQPGQAPHVKRIHVYSAAATASFGRPIGDVPCMGLHVPQLARAVVRDLYFADLAAHLHAATQLPPEDFPLDLYTTAGQRAQAA
ncbi:NAD(P)-binding domain-containing protein [Bordetella sp. N]|uniref:NAD(P)-binding domain-containing protein n=1 Tax=Bordetella sp. N TaxID=1746199 RepID=UPI00070B9136|nr:NAD(P)-binding domain-containing protein [Bordetella sp. N]ALM81619.1 hypothetical protein ASB57_00345 [Bordetella sp. N]